MTLTMKNNRFMSWQDLSLTPLVELTILGLSFGTVWRISHWVGFDWVGAVVAFYFVVVVWTLVVLKVIRMTAGVGEGIYTSSNRPEGLYYWKLYGFLCITNLSPIYLNAVIPPPLRKFFYQLMGARIGRGIISIGGRLAEPHLVTIEEGAMIGDDSLILPHVYTIGEEDTVVLGRVTIKRNAIIGAKTILMPGVTVGENSMVTAMSVVPMNTKIPPFEVWGGIPAKRLSAAPSTPVQPVPAAN